jgi:hypothetical protein
VLLAFLKCFAAASAFPRRYTLDAACIEELAVESGHIPTFMELRVG